MLISHSFTAVCSFSSRREIVAQRLAQRRGGVPSKDVVLVMILRRVEHTRKYFAALTPAIKFSWHATAHFVEVRSNMEIMYQDHGGCVEKFGGQKSTRSLGDVADYLHNGAHRVLRRSRCFLSEPKVAACLKLHGYSMGSYSQGFKQMSTADPAEIRANIADDCQVGVRSLGREDDE